MLLNLPLTGTQFSWCICKIEIIWRFLKKMLRTVEAPAILSLPLQRLHVTELKPGIPNRGVFLQYFASLLQGALNGSSRGQQLVHGMLRAGGALNIGPSRPGSHPTVAELLEPHTQGILRAIQGLLARPGVSWNPVAGSNYPWKASWL